MAGGKDGCRASNKYNSSKLAFKSGRYRVQRLYNQYDVCPTKNDCITVSIQKISSIYTLIQQILGCYEVNGNALFLTMPTQKSVK